MSYTEETLCNAVFESLRVVDPSIEASVIPRLRTMIPQAVERVAIRVANKTFPDGRPDRNFRNLLRKSLGTVSISSGVGDLSTLLTGTQPLLLDAVRSADIRTDEGQKIQMLADRASLDQDRPDAFLYGAIEGSTLYTDAPDGDLTVIANYIETDVTQY